MEIIVKRPGYRWSEVTVRTSNSSIKEDIDDNQERKHLTYQLFNAIYSLYDGIREHEIGDVIAELIADHLCDFEIEQIVKKIMSERRDLDFTLDEDE